jgi:hypothetical protein
MCYLFKVKNIGFYLFECRFKTLCNIFGYVSDFLGEGIYNFLLTRRRMLLYIFVCILAIELL